MRMKVKAALKNSLRSSSLLIDFGREQMTDKMCADAELFPIESLGGKNMKKMSEIRVREFHSQKRKKCRYNFENLPLSSAATKHAAASNALLFSMQKEGKYTKRR
jgi:hypothetical protein